MDFNLPKTCYVIQASLLIQYNYKFKMPFMIFLTLHALQFITYTKTFFSKCKTEFFSLNSNLNSRNVFCITAVLCLLIECNFRQAKYSMNILGIFRLTQGCIGIQLLFKRQLVFINPNIQIHVKIGIVYCDV
jgi:hypothetical protein